MLLAVAIALIWLAMWRLPAVLVDGDAYTLWNGEPDRAATQDAYNSVRVPIGVTAAALLAAIAAGAGVWMNSRTVAVARDSLAQTRANDDERRLQWRQEQLHSRFQDAAKQLGDTAASVRLAGVFSMARLADEWDDQRQSCVDVLTAYYRMPLKESNAAERQVRRVVLGEVLGRLSVGAPNSWSDCQIDLSGAFVEGLCHAGPLRIAGLNLEGATINDFAFLDQVQLDGRIVLDKVTFRDSFRLLATMGAAADVWAAGAKVMPDVRLHLGLWRPEDSYRSERHPGFVCLNINGLTIENARAVISLWGHFGQNFLFGADVAVADGNLVLVTREGSAAQGAFNLPAIEVLGRGSVLLNQSFKAGLSQDPNDFPGLVEVVDDDSDLLWEDMDPRKAIFI